MKKLLDLITEEMEQAFAKAGYDGKYARVTLSNRPDLCEYQCNGAFFCIFPVRSRQKKKGNL